MKEEISLFTINGQLLAPVTIIGDTTKFFVYEMEAM
jgi:hypothetical protein